jgi:hypothetical protein
MDFRLLYELGVFLFEFHFYRFELQFKDYESDGFFIEKGEPLMSTSDEQQISEENAMASIMKLMSCGNYRISVINILRSSL